MGHVDPRTLSPVFELTCITHRKDPVWVSIISQVTPSESSKIKAVGMSTLIHRFLKQRGLSGVLEVALMEPLVNLRPYVVLRMRKANDREPWDAMDALLEYGDRVGKFVVAVDDYAYLVPFVESEEELFLKTIIPSRKATKRYLGGR